MGWEVRGGGGSKGKCFVSSLNREEAVKNRGTLQLKHNTFIKILCYYFDYSGG